jgi:hypothetical protein
LSLQSLKLHLRNIPGWTTTRQIVVFESDDWGSVRMSGKAEFEKLLKSGLLRNDSYFIANDSLESNCDLELLFEVLKRYSDKNSINPVFTAVCVVANPDFEKIKENGFVKYEYEPFTETCRRYPFHNRVMDLRKEGIKQNLFIPEFHGREHLNVQKWMRELQSGNKALLAAFEQGVFGLSTGFNNEPVPEHLAAFDPEFSSDIPYMENLISDGVRLFESLIGRKPGYVVPPNNYGFHGIAKILRLCGIGYINSGRIQSEPLGDGKYKRQINWTGKENSLGQISLIRNCFFEPVLEESISSDPTDNCLFQIETAFRWNKPAIISTHRVNYSGLINENNRGKGLSALEKLLKKMLKKWPDLEFMSSVELGDTIRNSKS